MPLYNDVERKQRGLLSDILECSLGSTTIFLVKIALADDGAGLGAKFSVLSASTSDELVAALEAYLMSLT